MDLELLEKSYSLYNEKSGHGSTKFDLRTMYYNIVLGFNLYVIASRCESPKKVIS